MPWPNLDPSLGCPGMFTNNEQATLVAIGLGCAAACAESGPWSCAACGGIYLTTYNNIAANYNCPNGQSDVWP